MRIKEAIILAGGLGTRLKGILPDLPKCMAPIGKKPFISYVIDYLRMQGIERFIFSLGYKAGTIEKYLGEYYPTLQYELVLEQEPLGTGGAIQLACRQATEDHVLIVNGDTLFKVDLKKFSLFFEQHQAECALTLKPMKNFDRYGAVEIDSNSKIIQFKEKKFLTQGLINGGVYLIDRKLFLKRACPEKFSFEKDHLEKFVKDSVFSGHVEDGYFIDIGVPEDYQKAQYDLRSKAKLNLNLIDKNWTLFLDRDGVINTEKEGGYILNWSEFDFIPGTLDAFKVFFEKFGRIIIVTNQRGIGKNLMTEEDLKNIHENMVKEIESVGGKVDAIYHCSGIKDKDFYRKPNPGMAVIAVNDFKDIDLSKSIMVGNNPGDMQFGRWAGMFTVHIVQQEQASPLRPDIDLCFGSLKSFAQVLMPGTSF